MNGGATVYVGRSRNTVLAGRAVSAVSWGDDGYGFDRGFGGGVPANANGSLFWQQQWPRPMGVCAPIAQCCCAGPVSVAPGEVYPLMINWARWIESTPGFFIDSIASASLSDPANSMRPADHDVIKIVSGFREPRPGWNGNGNGNGGNGNGATGNGATGATGNGATGNGNGNGDEVDEWNADVSDLISLVPPIGTLVLVEVAPDARIGAQFKLDICLVAHDCDGRRIRQCQCVVITVAEC